MSPFTRPALSRPLVGLSYVKALNFVGFYFWDVRTIEPVTCRGLFGFTIIGQMGSVCLLYFLSWHCWDVRITSPIFTSQWVVRVLYGLHHKVARS
jgi:hypothetical protein